MDSVISIWACSLDTRVPTERQIGIALPLAVMNRIRRQNGGSARDYVPGSAWSPPGYGPTRERPSVCSCIGTLGVNVRSCRDEPRLYVQRQAVGWQDGVVRPAPGTAVASARDDHGGPDVSQRRLVAVWRCPATLPDSPHCPPATPRQNPTTLPAREPAGNVVDAATIIASAGCTLTLNRLRNADKPAAKDR